VQEDDYLEAVSGLKALQLHSIAPKKGAQPANADSGGEDDWEAL
jgi:hypothetical protein